MTLERSMFPPPADTYPACAQLPLNQDIAKSLPAGRPAAANYPVLSRRAFMSASSSVALITVASPSVASVGECPERIAVEQLRRAEKLIELLRTSCVRDGWKLDETAADRMLRFFGASAAFPTTHEAQPGYDDEWGFVVRFVGDHGQSLDWLMTGDVRGLICEAASRSRATLNMAPDPILAAIEDHRTALSEFLEHAGSDKDDNDPAFQTKFRTLDDRAEDAAVTLVNIQPTTMTGVLTLLAYIHEVNTGGIKSKSSVSSYSTHDDWPDRLVDDQIKNRRGHPIEMPFESWLIANIQAAIAEISAAA